MHQNKINVNTVVDALYSGTDESERGLSFLDDRFVKRDMSWAEISRESIQRGRYFSSLGLVKSDRLGMIIVDEREFVLSFLGALTIGVIPVPIYPPYPTGRLDSYLDRTASILISCEARRILISDRLVHLTDSLSKMVPSLTGYIRTDTMNVESKLESGDDYKRITIASDDICLLQYTSGSTGVPKGVIITHANLIAFVRALLDRADIDAEKDLGVCWLPLYHDMGLIFFIILPVILHARVIVMSPLAFVTRPWSWLETISKYQGTISASPNFGLALAARYADKSANLDLRCLRTIVCGAEPVNAETIRRFNRTFTRAGLKANVVLPAYSLAEATLAGTGSEIGKPFRSIWVDKDTYEKNGRIKQLTSATKRKAVEIVSCGPVIQNHEVGIIDPNGRLLEPGRVGEIVLRGPCITSGYFNNRKASSDLFCGDWMKTGDLGFLHDQELFISGRKKDLIIIAGRNYHPQNIEWIVDKIPKIRKGNVIAFSVTGDDTERLIVVAECKEPTNSSAINQAVRRAVLNETGLDVYKTILVEPNSLWKTSSGKPQRSKTRLAYLSGELVSIDTE